MSLTYQLRPLFRTARPVLKPLAAVPQSAAFGRRGVATKKEDVVKYLEKHGLFSDVIKFEPKCQLQARFLSSGDEVSFGNSITPLNGQGKPSVEISPFPGQDSLPSDLAGKTAYIVMTDPDAPSKDNPEWSEYAHWIAQVTLPNKTEEVVHNKDSKDVLEFAGPAPPEGTGPHRYLLLLLQGDKTDAQAPSERKKWGNSEQRTGVKQWAEQNGLKPVAANFFLSEHTPSDDTLESVHDDTKGWAKGPSGYGSA